ncbi:ATP-binding protein [Anaerotruncus sp. 1XD42-93]|uniref:ATP-binding protein n=1 Tax=Anaerotruncus sp. 1XD42-93 TaxID=2320853 RepID=UPI000EA32B43|nr:ATP-binding protein [Anaerotruncus sp. 1XD42-93]NBK20026.1 ATP-binding protein [Anaerotruncus sp. 1XD42-93]RKJ75736.1 ATP-binding protein [Anaerotruncus sp. 1XD22-93]
MGNDTILCPMLELSVLIPGAVSCYLPMKGHLDGKGRQIALWGIPALFLWAGVGGAVCYRFRWDTNLWMVPSLVFFALFYCRSVTLSYWKSVSVFLAVCGTFSNLRNLAFLADALLSPKSGPVVFSPGGAAAYALFCWTLLGLMWYPATHAARWLLDEIEMPGTWYVFWILPVVFWSLSIVMQPQEYSTLYTNRVMVFYPVLVLALLTLLLFCYALFYWMARGLAKNMRLAEENRLLQMQAIQYRILQKSIEDTRRARHDLRQHFKALQGCVESGDMAKVAEYVKAYGESLPPDTVRQFCKNYAVDAVLHHYGEQAVRQQTDMEVSVQMEEETIIPQPEFCALLGNLLENAIDGCAASKAPRIIRLHIRQQGKQALYLTLDNTSDQPPESNGGRFLSSSHDGFGIGTESVRVIAKRYNGDTRFEWKDGMFYVSVMLSAENKPENFR